MYEPMNIYTQKLTLMFKFMTTMSRVVYSNNKDLDKDGQKVIEELEIILEDFKKLI